MRLVSEFVSHAAFEKEHISKAKYTIVAPGHDFDGQVFYCETLVKKKNEFEFGDSEVIYYWPEELDDPREFDSLPEILKSKNLI